MSASAIGSNPIMAALLQSGQPQAPPPAVDQPDGGDTGKAVTAAGTGNRVDKSA
jgi:hypothetical protein